MAGGGGGGGKGLSRRQDRPRRRRPRDGTVCRGTARRSALLAPTACQLAHPPRRRPKCRAKTGNRVSANWSCRWDWVGKFARALFGNAPPLRDSLTLGEGKRPHRPCVGGAGDSALPAQARSPSSAPTTQGRWGRSWVVFPRSAESPAPPTQGRGVSKSDCLERRAEAKRLIPTSPGRIPQTDLWTLQPLSFLARGNQGNASAVEGAAVSSHYRPEGRINLPRLRVLTL